VHKTFIQGLCDAGEQHWMMQYLGPVLNLTKLLVLQLLD
jgi:hypothetical protein